MSAQKYLLNTNCVLYPYYVANAVSGPEMKVISVVKEKHSILGISLAYTVSHPSLINVHYL